jgi:hypothetical protein
MEPLEYFSNVFKMLFGHNQQLNFQTFNYGKYQ